MRETFFGPFEVKHETSIPYEPYYSMALGNPGHIPGHRNWAFCREAIRQQWVGIRESDTIWLSFGMTRTYQGVEGIEIRRIDVWSDYKKCLPRAGTRFYWRVWVGEENPGS